MSGIPEWAFNRAWKLFAAEVEAQPHGDATIWQHAFARFIAAHEQPPVDPVKAVLFDTFGAITPHYLARFHVELVKHGLQITPICSTGATK